MEADQQAARLRPGSAKIPKLTYCSWKLTELIGIPRFFGSSHTLQPVIPTILRYLIAEKSADLIKGRSAAAMSVR